MFLIAHAQPPWATEVPDERQWELLVRAWSTPLRRGTETLFNAVFEVRPRPTAHRRAFSSKGG